MRLCTVVHNNCTPMYQPDPDTSLLNTLKNQCDKVRLIAKMTDWGLYTILVKAVWLVCDHGPTYGPRLSNCWLPAATWVEALQKTGPLMRPSQLTFKNSTPQCQGHRYMDLWWHGLMDPRTVAFFVLATNTNIFIFSQKKRARLCTQVLWTKHGRKW